MATIPSISMIPSGYKKNKVYSVIPTNGNADLDFSRTGTATRINPSGLIETIADDVPRLDYTDGSCPSLLLEPLSTNLVDYSELFSNISWAKNGATVASGFPAPSVDSPLGAFKLVEDTSIGSHYIQSNSFAVEDEDSHTISVLVKKGESNFIQLLFGSTRHSNTNFANFDLLNGVIGSFSAGTPNIEPIGDYYKCSFSSEATATGSALGFIWKIQSATSTRGQSYTGDGTSGVYIFGAQIEKQTSATSYIPTNGGQQTRNSDSASKVNLVNSINSTQGVLYAEISALSDNETFRIISLSDNSFNNRVSIMYDTTSNRIRGQVLLGGLTQAAITFVVTDIKEYSKVAFKYSNNDFSLWVDGVKVGTDNNGSVMTENTLNKISFDAGSSSASTNFYGKCKDLRVFKNALSDEELTILTTV